MINIVFLKYFYDVATKESVSAAASLNSVSQPAISQGIRKLEQQLNLSLMHHKKNSLALTPEGREVLDRSHSVFSSISELEESLSYIESDPVGRVIIGTSHSIAKKLLPRIITQSKKSFPGIEVEIVLGKTQDLVRLIKKRKVDLALTIDDGLLDGLETEVVRSGHFKLIGETKKKLPILTTESRPEVRSLKQIKKYADYHYMQIESWEVIAEYVNQGIGAGLVPDFLSINDGNLKKIHPYSIVLIRSGDGFLNKIIHIFIDSIKKNITY